MNNYQDYSYNEVAFKASHNSYDKGSLSEQIEKGCQGLELDIAQSLTDNKWSVDHSDKYFIEDDKQLAKYLEELEKWSFNNSGHDIVTVYLDLKKVVDRSRTSQFPQQIDQYIRNHFPENKIYQPKDLMQNKWGLAYAARENGWPKLKDLENRFIFCLTGDDIKNLKLDLAQEVKRHYVNTKLRERICFADDRKRKLHKIFPGQRIYFNYNFREHPDPRIREREENWTDAIKMRAGQRDAITRGFGINKEEFWNKALETGFNVLATDQIDASWAKIADNSPFKIL